VIRVLHLFDSAADWQQRIGATQLFDRLPLTSRCDVKGRPAGRFECQAGAMDGAVRRSILPGKRRVRLFPRPFGIDFLTAPALRRHLARERIDVIHAWGIAAAVAASAAAPTVPLALELFDPNISERQARQLRSIHRPAGFALVCSTQTIRRRLIEQGLDPDLAVVIRPGADFAVINAAGKRKLRERLRLSDRDRVIITPEPATRDGGQFAAYWATGVRSFVEPGVRLIVPGTSPEQARIARLARQHRLEHLLRCPGDAFAFEELIAVADAMIVAPPGDVATTAIAWAMAAGVPVLGTAVYAIAELIADRQNGLLVKPDAPRRLGLRLAAMLEDRELLSKLQEPARGQAYTVFSVRSYVDRHARLYDNLISGTAPGEGIIDSALNAQRPTSESAGAYRRSG